MKKIKFDELILGSTSSGLTEMNKTLLEIKNSIDLGQAIIAIDKDDIIFNIYKEYLIQKNYELKIFNIDNNEIINKEDLLELNNNKKIYLIKSKKYLNKEEKISITEKILIILVKEKINFTKCKLKIFN